MEREGPGSHLGDYLNHDPIKPSGHAGLRPYRSALIMKEPIHFAGPASKITECRKP